MYKTINYSTMIMVESESDLDSLTNVDVGSIAFTAGYGDVWQFGLDNEWHEVDSTAYIIGFHK